MGERGGKMNKALFGYDPNAVERMLQERDTMLKVAERRVQAAEAKAADLESRLESAERTAPPPDAGSPPSTPVVTPPGVRDLAADAVPEELAKVVNAAEASASQIIQAWTATRDQIMEADRLWRDVQDEVVRFAAWRDDVEPLMAQVQACIEDARRRIEEVPSRVQTALAPAVDAMVNVSEGMTKFATVSTMPLLPAPARRAQAPRVPIEPDPEPVFPPMQTSEYPTYEVAPVPDDPAPEAPWEERRPDPGGAPRRHNPWGDEPAPESGQLDRLAEAAVSHGPDENGRNDHPDD